MSDEKQHGTFADEGADVAGVPEELRVFGHFQLLRELGRGAQGVVYLAEDTLLHRQVALKMLAGAAAQSHIVRERFRREAELTSKLDHPGICGIHEVGKEQEIPYIAMQFVRGTTLAEMLEKARSQDGEPDPETNVKEGPSTTTLRGKNALQDVLLLIERAARALHVAHVAGLVHRDIKPGNIMVTPEGRPVLLDFGLARDFEDQGQTLTETGQVMGTPAYMAPEQLLGNRKEIDGRSDVYSLGATLYECLTLRRPFEAESFEVLYQLILRGAPPDPRQFNPRIPRDLATITEVALERDRSRRYASALDLAEDLRRLRAFEPIQAKPASTITRARKWARRNPAKFVGVTSIGLFLLAGLGFGVYQNVARVRAARQHLARAERLLAESDFTAALEAVAQARERSPASTRVLELKSRIEGARDQAELEERRLAAFVAAAAAREESAQKQEELGRVRTAIRALGQEIERERGVVFDAYAPDERRGGFARTEQAQRERRLEAERLLLEAQEALERAARLEAPFERTAATQAAFAGFYMSRWREAELEGDAARMALYRSAVERHDAEGRHRLELLGRGTIRVAVDPPDAQLYLFRYEPYETVRSDDPVPRLVPVPTSGIGRVRTGPWSDGFHPGDQCLRVNAVESGSIASEAGLRPGDLVMRLNEHSSGGGLFLTSPTEGSRGSGVLPPSPVARLNGVEIHCRWDWDKAPPAEDGGSDLLVLGSGTEIPCDRATLAVAEPVDLVERGDPERELSLLCLRDGVPVSLGVPASQGSGLRCELTAYPLIHAEENRVRTQSVIECDPGSYLLVARCEGFVDQRYPFLVPRQGEASLRLSLLRSGSIPDGFVHVPAGTFRHGGDPDALEPSASEDVELPGFFIGRREVTNREWFEFLEDHETRAKMESSAQPIYVPRQQRGGPMPRENLGGPETPVMGVSWNDVRDYVDWRNAQAEAANEPWVYDLPTELQWEKAARGVDGRAYPWGDRFDLALVAGLYTRPRHLYDAPGGIEPRDESPSGVQDAAGHRQEWTLDPYRVDPNAPPFYRRRGGCWRLSGEQAFRVASRSYEEAAYAGGNLGFRLVARPRGPE
jgi:serine/threonine protein kinase/formylglycine-generating enzyme required for sulfatase activity